MKKELIAIAVAAVVLVILVIYFGIYGGENTITFEPVSEKAIPRKLQAEVIPSYRDLERALVCREGEQIYVLAMRGEKPTSGYEIQITKLELVTEAGKSKLVVYADFVDPKRPEDMAQVKCYPVSVVRAELQGLPDLVELRSSYPKD